MNVKPVVQFLEVNKMLPPAERSENSDIFSRDKLKIAIILPARKCTSLSLLSPFLSCQLLVRMLKT